MEEILIVKIVKIRTNEVCWRAKRCGNLSPDQAKKFIEFEVQSRYPNTYRVKFKDRSDLRIDRAIPQFDLDALPLAYVQDNESKTLGYISLGRVLSAVSLIFGNIKEVEEYPYDDLPNELDQFYITSEDYYQVKSFWRKLDRHKIGISPTKAMAQKADPDPALCFSLHTW